MKSLFPFFEHMIGTAVDEEVDRRLQQRLRSLTRTPSLTIRALEPSSLCLMFAKILSLPIFTASNISDVDSNRIRILVMDKNMTGSSHQPVPISLPGPIKVEMVVLEADFPSEDKENWASKDFDNNVLKERTGKRPLFIGDVNVTVRNGFATIGDIKFTDNLSWTPSRKFRLGARVVPGTAYQGPRIREAMTDAFVVKEHRGECKCYIPSLNAVYKKHHPPMLEDEVWRLEKIGKDGPFHRKLGANNIRTVQDFLKMLIVDPLKLKKTLGIGMSDKMWEVTVRHAKTCSMGNKLYIFRGPYFELYLSPICEVMKVVMNGQTTLARDLSNYNKNYFENLARQAHANWSSLEVVDTLLNETASLTDGQVRDQHYPQAMMVRTSDHNVINNGQQQEQLDHSKCIGNAGAAGDNLQSNTMMMFECSDNWNISSLYSSFSPFMDILVSSSIASPQSHHPQTGI